jgi:hypothetical protein
MCGESSLENDDMMMMIIIIIIWVLAPCRLVGRGHLQEAKTQYVTIILTAVRTSCLTRTREEHRDEPEENIEEGRKRSKRNMSEETISSSGG